MNHRNFLDGATKTTARAALTRTGSARDRPEPRHGVYHSQPMGTCNLDAAVISLGQAAFDQANRAVRELIVDAVRPQFYLMNPRSRTGANSAECSLLLVGSISLQV